MSVLFLLWKVYTYVCTSLTHVSLLICVTCICVYVSSLFFQLVRVFFPTRVRLSPLRPRGLSVRSLLFLCSLLHIYIYIYTQSRASSQNRRLPKTSIFTRESRRERLKIFHTVRPFSFITRHTRRFDPQSRNDNRRVSIAVLLLPSGSV